MPNENLEPELYAAEKNTKYILVLPDIVAVVEKRVYCLKMMMLAESFVNKVEVVCGES
jgi:hypothetical protein